jgi:hypothetical protein
MSKNPSNFLINYKGKQWEYSMILNWNGVQDKDNKKTLIRKKKKEKNAKIVCLFIYNNKLCVDKKFVK